MDGKIFDPVEKKMSDLCVNAGLHDAKAIS